MIKRTISAPERSGAGGTAWLRLDEVAEVEITSESAEHPIEAALTPGDLRGWEAAEPGEQTIRLRFPAPRAVHQIRLVAEERGRARTQQWVLRASLGAGGGWHELVRQQYNFSPAGATRQQEDYRVELPTVAALELRITPDLNGGDARASLQAFHVAAAPVTHAP